MSITLTTSGTLLHPLSIQNREQRAAIIAKVRSFADAPAPIPPDQVRELLTFENTIYPVIQSDKRWFFANIGKTEAIQFARDLNVLHSFAARTLEQLFARRGEWSHGDDDPLLWQVIAFALYHHGAAVKWCFFRHEPVKPTLWPELHALYDFAELHAFASTPLVLFNEESHYRTTILALYLRALLLEVLNTGSLTMPQIEIADGWLAEWTPEYVLEDSYTPRAHALFVDLQTMAGLQVVTGNMSQPGHRYLRVDGLKDQMDTVRIHLRAGSTYLGRGAPNAFAMEEHVALLATIERLYTTMLQASASRIEERTPVSDLFADVRLGFADALRIVTNPVPHADAPTDAPMKFGGLALSLDLSSAASTPQAPASDTRWTRWRIHDMSSKGVGLMVERTSGERIGVGQLLALKPDGFKHFMLGVIVRKLTQRTIGETLVGVEILSYRPLPITLARYVNARDTSLDPETAPIAALYLPGRNPDGKSDILVLPAGNFGLKIVFELPSKTERFRVRINRVLRKGSDWVGLRFEVIGKQGQ